MNAVAEATREMSIGMEFAANSSSNYRHQGLRALESAQLASYVPCGPDPHLGWEQRSRHPGDGPQGTPARVSLEAGEATVRDWRESRREYRIARVTITSSDRWEGEVRFFGGVGGQ